jgi:hypothetical protein
MDESNWVKIGTGYRPDDSPYQVNKIHCTECDHTWDDDGDEMCVCEEEEDKPEEEELCAMTLAKAKREEELLEECEDAEV